MAKPYNHRRAENKYKKWKEKDEQFMEKNGMPMDKILLMRDFDRVQTMACRLDKNSQNLSQISSKSGQKRA